MSKGSEKNWARVGGTLCSEVQGIMGNGHMGNHPPLDRQNDRHMTENVTFPQPRSLYMKSIYSHRGYVTNFSCSKSYKLLGGQRRLLRSHSISQWMACAAHTHIHLTIFKILRSSKYIFVEKKCTKYINVIMCSFLR